MKRRAVCLRQLSYLFAKRVKRVLCDCSLKDIFHERAWLKSDIFSVQVCVNCQTVYIVPNTFLSLRNNNERILMKFAGGVITKNRLNDYILGKIGTETKEQATRENSN